MDGCPKRRIVHGREGAARERFDRHAAAENGKSNATPTKQRRRGEEYDMRMDVCDSGSFAVRWRLQKRRRGGALPPLAPLAAAYNAVGTAARF